MTTSHEPTHRPRRARPAPASAARLLGLPPALGYPVLVESDGKISLPLLKDPLLVKGKSLAETKEIIRTAYTKDKGILTDQSRILVTLQRRRRYHVLVVRQDSPGAGGA